MIESALWRVLWDEVEIEKEIVGEPEIEIVPGLKKSRENKMAASSRYGFATLHCINLSPNLSDAFLRRRKKTDDSNDNICR